jgi:glycerol-3-phosphate dehydrogenase
MFREIPFDVSALRGDFGEPQKEFESLRFWLDKQIYSSHSLLVTMASTILMRAGRSRCCLASAATVRTIQPLAYPSASPRYERGFVSFSRSRWHKQNSSSHNGSSGSTDSSSSTRDAGLAFTSVLSDPKDVPGPRGIPSRAEQLRRLQEAGVIFDVLVVGGGATGAGTALDAASRGLSVACVERGDFASETSSRSTKLIWAGIRYMGTATAALLSPKLWQHPVDTVHQFVGEMKMVWHCHVERRYMTSVNRHLCNWIPIAVPFNSWHISPPPMGHPLFGYFPFLAPVVFKFYDTLSVFTCPPSYVLTKSRAQRDFPQLDPDGLKYAAVFYEAQHNDSRTNLAIAMTAAEKGAAIANYTEMVDLIHNEAGRVVGAVVLDRMTGKQWKVYAKKVVLAGGPFTDQLRSMEAGKVPPAVRGSAGTHIVLPGYFVPHNMGLLDCNTSDGRFLFILPWLGHTLIGTTDKKGPAETLQNPPEDEVVWLLKESQKFLRKDLKVRRSDVLSAWRGWRPLAVDPHATADSPVSRDHVISENPESGVIFIAGGKWTTWREMAQEVIDRVVGPSGPPSLTLDIPLHGAEGYENNLAIQLIQRYGMDTTVAEHLVKTYGGRAWEVCELMQPTGKAWPKFGNLLVEGFPYIDAEVLYATREYACTIEDVLSRRTRLAYLNRDAAVAAIEPVADILARELGWTAKAKEQQIQAARNYVESYSGRKPDQAGKLLREASYQSPIDIFTALDTDHSGFLDQQEVMEVATILGFQMSSKEVTKAFEQMDKDGFGRVSVEAFQNWWHAHPNSAYRKHLLKELGVGETTAKDRRKQNAA